MKTYVSPYDWRNLQREDGRFIYYQDGIAASQTGVDVSSHQGAIDWGKVASDGIDFAMVRLGNRGATEGQVYLDEFYHNNIAGVKAAGIDVGVYFFSQAINEKEAREEAEFVIANLDGTSLQYPVVFDHEPVAGIDGRADGITGEELTRCARAFCEVIERAGYTAMIYGNKQDIARYDLDALSGYEVWFAEYDATYPSGQFDFSIWQYANNGAVAGIDTAVDMNIHFPDVARE